MIIKPFPYLFFRVAALPFDYLHIDQEISEEEIKSSHLFYVHNQMLEKERALLRQWSREAVFRKGLVQSSRSFEQRLISYLKKTPADFRKKEFQTERRLLQYLSRVAGKVSPFSTFTGVGVVGFNSENIPVIHDSLISPNNYILTYLKGLLLSIPECYQQLFLAKNSLVENQDDQLIYLLNKDNVEVIQQIENNQMLEVVLTQFDARPTIKFTDLQNLLGQQIEADPEQIHQLLLQLINAGLLEWQWKINSRTSDWGKQLISFIKEMDSFEWQTPIINLLTLIIKNSQGYTEADTTQRKNIQDISFEALNSFFNAFNFQGETKNNAYPINLPPFKLSKERIFYEDTAGLTPDYGPTDNQLVSLQKIADFCTDQNQSNRLFKFIEDFYPPQFTISFFRLYQDYYRQIPDETPWSKLPQDNEVDAVLLKDIFRKDQQGVVHLSSNQLPKSDNKKSIYQHGTLIQPNNQDQFYLDAFISGYGKMVARFLPLFSNQVADDFKAWNTSFLEKDTIAADLTDASVFNANHYPPLFEYEIISPGGESHLPKEQQISIDDIDVKKNEYNLQLIQRSTGKIIKVRKLSLEAPPSRSPMYQLLYAFTDAVPDKYRLVGAANILYQETDEKGTITLPEIRIDGSIFIQRKTFYIPKEELIVKANAETEADYYQRFQEWCKLYHIGRYIYITLHSRALNNDQAANTNGEVTKPQLIDTKSPSYVSLAGRMLKKSGDYLKVEAAWPTGSDLLSVDEKLCMVECCIFWSREEVT